MVRFNTVLLKYSLAAVLLAAVTGCGGTDEGDGFTGERGKVSGTVTLDGQPVKEGCQVVFMSNTGYTGAGVVQSDGTYTVEYSDPGGLPVGEYLVQLAAPFVPDTTEPTDPTKMGPKLNIGPDGKVAAAPSGPFPTKYGSTSTSELKSSIKAGDNTADFKLTK